MAEISSSDIETLGAFPKAPTKSWSTLLTERQRQAFRRVNRTLRDIVEEVATKFDGDFQVATTSGFHDKSGVRNQRPKDLWASLVNVGADDFVGMPQIYIIASGRGVEIGFAAAIHRADFSNTDVKKRLSAVIPALFHRLPNPNSPLVTQLQTSLTASGGWHYRDRLRQETGDDFSNAAELLTDLHSDEGKQRGSGAICRYYSPAELDGNDLSLSNEFAQAADLFAPLMRSVSTYAKETEAFNRALVAGGTNQTVAELSLFNPAALEDARALVVTLIVQRRGQGVFRSKLMQAYGGKCAVTGTAASAILEAAHIVPYKGDATNIVSNGILLRADIHTLFDLGLLKIKPDFRVWVSDIVTDHEYRKLNNRRIHRPAQAVERPHPEALQWRWDHVNYPT